MEAPLEPSIRAELTLPSGHRSVGRHHRPRQLFRISALLEVADDQFELVRLGAERLSSSYEQSVLSGELDLPIDRASVAAYIDSSPRTQRWIAAAIHADFKMERPDWDDTDPEPDDDTGVGELTQASQLAGFTELA